MTIRVLVADDHPVVRAGICNELARHSDIAVVGEAVNGDEALRLTEGLHPDVLLLDIAMPGMKAVQVVRELRARSTSPQILVLTAYGDLDNVLGMLGAGATGYLLKDEDLAVIAEGVRAVAQGEMWLSAAVTQRLAQHAVGKSALAPAPTSSRPLSAREVEVLRLMAKGYFRERLPVDISPYLESEPVAQPDISPLHKCNAARSKCIVSPIGEVSPCSYVTVSAGNIRNGGLERIWLHSNTLQFFRDSTQLEEPCRSCVVFKQCGGGCRARAWLESGRLSAPDPACRPPTAVHERNPL